MKTTILKNAVLAISLAACCLVNAAHAGIIDEGDYTTVNGVDWLDMSFTDGKSYNEVLSLIQSGNTLFGWRVASFIEVETMYQGFGYTDTPNSTDANWNAVPTLYPQVLKTLGMTFDCVGGCAFTVGYVSDLSSHVDPAGRQQTVQTGMGSYETRTSPGLWRADSGTEASDVGNTHIGTYLTRSGVAVPEPSTLAIFALGMIGLASRRFKKQS